MANRLATATSPYLLQHKDNPVEWWEWGPEPFAEARRLNRPVLLSVGYAACHWCHVMAHESFEDEATAAYLNEHFVSVKVDREERPNVDAVYMQATTAMTGSGGWPMTCVSDHEGVPFFAGTYFPDQPRHGQPSFGQVLQALSQAWTSQPEEVQRVAGSIRDHLRGAVVPAGEEPVDAQVLDQAVETFGAEFDPTNGGFGTAPKFPPSMVLEFLRRTPPGYYRPTSGGAPPGCRPHTRRDGPWWPLRPARRRLRPLQRRPRLGGPALREDALRQRPAGRPLRTPRWRPRPPGRPRDRGLPARRARHRRGCVRVRARRRQPRRGRAQPRGRYYAWTPAELDAVLGDDADWAAQLLTVTDAGTFEEGASTLQLRSDPDDAERWASVRQRLLAARSGRVRPARDDKVVAAWNGLAVSGLVDAGLRLDAPAYAPRRGPVRVVPVGRALGRRGGCAGSPATASSVPTPACSRTTAAWRRRTSTSRPRPPTRCGWSAPAPCSTSRWHGSRPATAVSSTPPTTPSPSCPALVTRPTTPAPRGCRRWRMRCSATRRSPAPASSARSRRVR